MPDRRIFKKSSLAILDDFYSLLSRLETVPSQGKHFKEYAGRFPWPDRGVYFFREVGENRTITPNVLRIVRVGTHALKHNSKTSLWDRLKQHRGSETGNGNHRGSVFRLHVGAAILNKSNGCISTWGVGSSAPPELRSSPQLLAAELCHEKLVSQYIGNLKVYWINVPDEAGPQSKRSYIERNAIALLSNQCEPFDSASKSWLGNYSTKPEISRSALWNINHVYESYDLSFISILEEAVNFTVRNAA